MALHYLHHEGIHDLRVEIKRLKAFFNFIEGMNPSFKSKKNFREIRTLFKAWGKIRDIQVQQSLAREWESKLHRDLSPYYNFLKQEEIEAWKPFFRAGEKFNLELLTQKKKRIRKALKELSTSLARSKAVERLNGLIYRLIEFGESPILKEAELHQVRILLKETRYTLEISQGCFPDLGIQDEQIGRLRDLHQILGKWHDAEVTLQFLEAFKSEAGDPEFFKGPAYRELFRYIQKEKATLRTKFEDPWKDFILFFRGGL